MTPYDAAMAGVVVAGMVWGAIRGITWQVASILSLVLGYTASQPLSGQIAPYMPGEPVVGRALAMIAVYFLVSGGVFLGAWLIRTTLRTLQFEAYDRHLGMVLGGFEGAFIGLVATLFVVSLAPSTRDPIFRSPTGRLVGQVMSTLGPVLPGEARTVLAPFWQAAPTSTVEAAPESLPSLGKILTAPPTAQPKSDKASNARTAAASTSIGDFIERSEKELGKAVLDGATQGLQRAASGGVSGRENGSARRR